MVPLLKVLGTFLVGFAALAALFWGWILWLPLAVGLGADRGGPGSSAPSPCCSQSTSQ
jgi:hypothetical protein